MISKLIEGHSRMSVQLCNVIRAIEFMKFVQQDEFSALFIFWIEEELTKQEQQYRE